MPFSSVQSRELHVTWNNMLFDVFLIATGGKV